MTKNTTISYWHNNAKYTAWMEENYPLLVKPSGPSDTIEGELIRAISRLNHDLGNNGMCNNTSGACNFIKEVMDLDNDVLASWKEVYNESNTGGYTCHHDLFKPLTILSDAVIGYVISKNGNYETMDNDLFNYQDPAYVYEDADDEEGYYDDMGHYIDN